MRTKLFCLVAFAMFAASASAQNGQLSLGLSTTYYPTGVMGLGGTLDYRWRLGAHLEAIGQFSAVRFWWLDQPRNNGGSASTRDAGNLYFGGLGLGYRASPTGFHVGLLGGGMYYLETSTSDKTEPRFMPGLALVMGHGIGERLDLSLDTWILMGTDEKKAIGVLPMFRFSYALYGRK